MVSELRHEHVGDHAFGGQRTLDEVRRRRRLGDAFLALAAGVLRAHRDDDLKLRRNDVKALGAVLADLRHLATTAGAQRALGLDHVKDPRQVRRQMTEVALRGRALRARRSAWCSPGASASASAPSSSSKASRSWSGWSFSDFFA